MRVFIDMDGTVAEWIPDGDYHLKGYFSSLKTNGNVVKAVNLLIRAGIQVYILSCAEGERVREEKMEWLRRFLPNIPEENIIFTDAGKKAEFVGEVKESDILLDDYSKNLLEWPGKGIKLLNQVNGAGKKWRGSRVSMYDDPRKIALRIASFA